MVTKDIEAEKFEPTFLEGDLPDSQSTIFVTRHTLGEILGGNSEDSERAGSSKGNKDNF